MSAQVHVQVTHVEADSIGYVPYWKQFPFTVGDLDDSDTFAVAIPPKSLILAVALLIVTAFDNGADGKVGDSATDDGYIDASMTTPTTKDDFASSFGSDANYAAGKYYPDPDRLEVVLSATPTVGEAILLVLFGGVEV